MLERFYDCSFKRRRILLALGLHSDEVGWITDVMSSPLYHRRWRRSDHDDHINHRRWWWWWWWWWWWLAVVNYSQSIEMSSLINCDWSFNRPWLGILWLIIFNHVIIAFITIITITLQLLQLLSLRVKNMITNSINYSSSNLINYLNIHRHLQRRQRQLHLPNKRPELRHFGRILSQGLR